LSGDSKDLKTFYTELGHYLYPKFNGINFCIQLLIVQIAAVVDTQLKAL
jgi:hypothetical protein